MHNNSGKISIARYRSFINILWVGLSLTMAPCSAAESKAGDTGLNTASLNKSTHTCNNMDDHVSTWEEPLNPCHKMIVTDQAAWVSKPDAYQSNPPIGATIEIIPQDVVTGLHGLVAQGAGASMHAAEISLTMKGNNSLSKAANHMIAVFANQGGHIQLASSSLMLDNKSSGIYKTSSNLVSSALLEADGKESLIDAKNVQLKLYNGLSNCAVSYDGIDAGDVVFDKNSSIEIDNDNRGKLQAGAFNDGLCLQNGARKTFGRHALNIPRITINSFYVSAPSLPSAAIAVTGHGSTLTLASYKLPELHLLDKDHDSGLFVLNGGEILVKGDSDINNYPLFMVNGRFDFSGYAKSTITVAKLIAHGVNNVIKLGPDASHQKILSVMRQLQADNDFQAHVKGFGKVIFADHKCFPGEQTPSACASSRHTSSLPRHA
jgi:hypothetical protein